MLKVWGRKTSSNVRKVLWCAAELGLEYERVDIAGPFGGNDAPEYLALNPNGLVPTIEDDGNVIWESNTIIRYLSAKHDPGGLWPDDLGARAQADKWMDWQLFALLPHIGPIFRIKTREAEENWDLSTIAQCAEAILPYWQMLDANLAGKPFVAGERLTMGDIPVGFQFHRWKALVEERPTFANLDAWHGRLNERPGYREIVSEGGI